MRKAVWCWACAVVLFVGCGDDGKEGAAGGGSSGDAGSGSDEVGGESAGGSASGAIGPGGSASGSTDPGGSGPGAEAGAAGAASNEEPLGPYASGTRLSAITYAAGSDAKQWIGWFDFNLDVACAFRLSEDGKQRCMPTTYINGFMDADCTQPVVVAQPGCAPPPVFSQGTGACGDELAGYELGEKIVTPAKTYIYSGQLCQEAVFGGNNGEFYALAKLAPTAFVAAEQHVNPRDEAVSMTYLQAEDGALQPQNPFDVARGHGCRPLTTGPFAGRCAPAYTGYASASVKFFSDESCTDRIAHDPSCREAPLDAIALLTVAECGSQVEFNYAEAGAKAVALSQETNNQCITPNNKLRFYEIGDPIPATGVPDLATTDLGAGRIKARYFADANGVPLTFATFYDSELDTECGAHATADGLRCLPPSSFLSSFADDACTTLIVTVPQPVQGCVEAEPPLYSYSQADAVVAQCGDGETPLRVFKTGSKIAKPNVVYAWSESQCVATGGQLGDHVFYGATEVPITDFAEVDRELE